MLKKDSINSISTNHDALQKLDDAVMTNKNSQILAQSLLSEQSFNTQIICVRKFRRPKSQNNSILTKSNNNKNDQQDLN